MKYTQDPILLNIEWKKQKRMILFVSLNIVQLYDALITLHYKLKTVGELLFPHALLPLSHFNMDFYGNCFNFIFKLSD